MSALTPLQRTLLLLFVFCLPVGTVYAADTTRFVLMRPTGLEYKGIPLLEVMPPCDRQARIMERILEHTFLKEFAGFHQTVTDTLMKLGLVSRREPLYLLASGRMGGFPMKGFFLKKGGRITDKRDQPYIDLKGIEENYKRLESVTQVFPHEQAHIYFRLFSGTDALEEENYSCDMHYFSMVTNYFTAFNEGFAESFENIARRYEPDTSVRRAIERDTDRKTGFLEQRSRGFDRDFRWPLRLGFYRFSMIAWYQPLENYKRFRWAYNGYAKYKALPFNSCSAERSLLYRNACVIPDTLATRNRPQGASTEGVVCAFFTLLMESPAREMNRGDASMAPWKNQVLKELRVIGRSLRNADPGMSLLDAFVSGYLLEYPAEKEIVMDVYHRATGHKFTGEPMTQRWLFNPDHSHNTFIMAQYGGSLIPYYAFNLNTADAADLATFPGMKIEQAGKLIRYRDSIGGFLNFSRLASLPGDLEETGKMLAKKVLQKEALSRYGEEPAFSLGSFFTAIILRALLLWGILFALSLFIQMLFFRRLTRFVRTSVRELLRSLLFLLAAIATLVFPYPPIYLFAGFTLLVIGIDLLITRRNHEVRKELLLSAAVLFLTTGYSLV
jgi:hypothetical protein